MSLWINDTWQHNIFGSYCFINSVKMTSIFFMPSPFKQKHEIIFMKTGASKNWDLLSYFL